MLLLLSTAVVTLRVNSPGSDTFQGSGIPGPIQSVAYRFALTVGAIAHLYTEVDLWPCLGYVGYDLLI